MVCTYVGLCLLQQSLQQSYNSAQVGHLGRRFVACCAFTCSASGCDCSAYEAIPEMETGSHQNRPLQETSYGACCQHIAAKQLRKYALLTGVADIA